jgi:hypothetical protein
MSCGKVIATFICAHKQLDQRITARRGGQQPKSGATRRVSGVENQAGKKGEDIDDETEDFSRRIVRDGAVRRDLYSSRTAAE